MAPPRTPYRKHLRRREGSGKVRFMTFSCYRRLPLLGHPAIRDLFVATLAAAKAKHGFALYAWVVMPEHLHLIFRPAPGGSWEAIASSLKTSVARSVLSRWRALDAPILQQLLTPGGETHFWQPGGGFDRDIRDQAELLGEIAYTHRNPVRRGLVPNTEDWKWSSVHWWMGIRGGNVECDVPPGDPKAWAAWKGFK